jgi:hypothetical protein
MVCDPRSFGTGGFLTEEMSISPQANGVRASKPVLEQET